MERRELICIGCPLGCSLTVSMEGAKVVSVTGIPASGATCTPEKK